MAKVAVSTLQQLSYILKNAVAEDVVHGQGEPDAQLPAENELIPGMSAQYDA